jgi:hypothetical protein
MAPTTIEPLSSGERATGKARAASAADETTRAGAKTAAVAPSGRVFWKAIVRTGGMFAASRERDRVEWHLAACDAPAGEGRHCSEGQQLIAASGQPDGHCVIDGRCGRCGEKARRETGKAA